MLRVLHSDLWFIPQRQESAQGAATPKCMERALTVVVTLCNSETYLWRRGKEGKGHIDEDTNLFSCLGQIMLSKRG